MSFIASIFIPTRSEIDSSEGSGNNFIEDAILDLTINPMIQNPFSQYSKLLVNIHGGNDINFDNVEYIVETLRKKTQENSNIIFGFIQNKK